jgi:hypothetical protein
MFGMDEEYEGTLLTIEAEIISKEPEGFIIKVHNSETGKTFEAQSVREYAEFLVESVNSSVMDNFVAKWLPSPNARRRDIDLVGMQLGMMQQWMEEEIKQDADDELKKDLEDLHEYSKDKNDEESSEK